MYKLISDIAERCHTAAEKRGKDTTANGCIEALRTEQQEYWNAVDKGHYVPDFDVMVREATNYRIGILPRCMRLKYTIP